MKCCWAIIKRLNTPTHTMLRILLFLWTCKMVFPSNFSFLSFRQVNGCSYFDSVQTVNGIRLRPTDILYIYSEKRWLVSMVMAWQKRDSMFQDSLVSSRFIKEERVRTFCFKGSFNVTNEGKRSVQLNRRTIFRSYVKLSNR